MRVVTLGGVLVIGGGIAGITATLDLADQGHKVYLLEREPSIGGRMAQLDKTFPTLDCSICILAPKMVEVSRHPKVELLTYSGLSRVQPIDGGKAFRVEITRKPRYVDETMCTGCRTCVEKCPVKVPSEFDEGLGFRKAIYIPFPQAVPAVAVVDRDNCLYFQKGVCRICERFCPAHALNFNQTEHKVELEVASIIVATGFDLLDPSRLPQYGYGRFPNVITSIEYERIMNAAGPTGGKIVKPSDHIAPERVAFIQCVGSRNIDFRPYCSQICCMYATKEAIVTKEHSPNVDVTVFYNDLRAAGKGHQELMRRAAEEFNIKYVKGLPSEIQLDLGTEKLAIRHGDLSTGRTLTTLADLVVLCPAIVPKSGTSTLARTLGIDVTEFGFFKSMGSPAPVDTSVPGIYLCGACEGAKDISHSVAQASASAARATSCAGPVKAGVERIEAKERPLGREPRVGAFVCDCGVNIRAVVDVPRVVEFAKSLDGVVHAEEFMFACSKDSIDKIKEAIGRCNLNRVVVASCTPRTHEPLFRATCEEVGLNPYLFEMVNIREHDSWVHTGQPEEATRKAMDLVRMAVAKARRLHPLKRLETDVERSALVVGGSIAGMVAAKAIADNGFKVYLVEGGEGLGRPYSDEFVLPFENIDINSLLSPLIRQVENHENIQVFLSTRVKEVKGALGSLDVTLLQESHTNTLKTGVIIVATEGEKLKPHGLYGYGEYEDVVTTPEFRQMVGQGKIADGETIALILCVGAREREGRTYCSAVCCSEAVDLVHWVKKRWPKSQIYVLYRDMVLPLEGEAWYSEARERGIVFIRYAEELPPKVSLVEKQLTISVRDVTLGSRLNITADKIVLVTPMIPGKTNPNLASTLKVPLTTQGFFLEAHPKLRPLDFATDGIYLCGTCHSPQGIAEAVFQGLGAASRALVPLMKARVSSEAITAEVDPNRCIACGNCEAVCEYGSIRVDGSFAEVNPFLCKGCGLCSVECPAMAITMHHYTDDQTSSMIREATEAWRHEDKLRALAFFCNWCAYAAADMAGVSRFQYPPTVRIIRVMCTGRVDQTHVLQAFLDGADGVLIGGCHPGDCHYVAGNIKAEGRVRKMKRWLKEAGLEPERLSLVWVSAGEGKILAEAIEDFTNQLEGLGPSPLREVRGG